MVYFEGVFWLEVVEICELLWLVGYMVGFVMVDKYLFIVGGE